MTPKQLLEFDSYAYMRRLEANRGHNHSYMTDELYHKLNERGYEAYKFSRGTETYSELEAIEVRDRLRKQGNYARIISTANRLRIRTYEVYFKGRLILDPDADGKQWIYRGMGICEQNHPSLLPYACYDWERDNFLIGVANSKKSSMQLIDKYIAEGKTAKTYIIYHQ